MTENRDYRPYTILSSVVIVVVGIIIPSENINLLNYPRDKSSDYYSIIVIVE